MEYLIVGLMTMHLPAVENNVFHIFQLPEGVNVSKDARLAISKAASVFVLYATSW